jgi:hypothetical protein
LAGHRPALQVATADLAVKGQLEFARILASKTESGGFSQLHDIVKEKKVATTDVRKPQVPKRSGPTMRTELLRLNGAVERDPAIDAWMKEHAGELGAIAHQWFEVMRKCGDEVRELLHDGCPVVCLGDAPFGYVNVFTSHVNVGFFHGAALPDPAGLLQGTGKFMRHVKLRPGTAANAAALRRLIGSAYSDIKARVENG